MKIIICPILAIALSISSMVSPISIMAQDTTTALAQQDGAVAMQTILNNYRNYVAGDVETNKNTSLASKIKGVETSAKSAFDAYQGDSQPEELFAGISIRKADTQDKDNSDNFKTTAQKIYTMALGYATSGTQMYQNPSYAQKINDALDKFYTIYSQSMTYHPGGLLYGNWWNWEIGVPTQLSNTFALMYTEIQAYNPDLLNQYVACFDNNLRNGKNGDVDLSAPQHTGTNLADITMNRILQGAVTKDEQRIQKAANDLMSVFATIDPYHLQNGNTDGIYADGSFIQHHRVAYTGSYGKLLLQRAVQSVIILNDTPWQPQGQLETIQNWIYKSFAPFMYEGYMMETVKGRAVSRTTTGYQDSAGVIESMVLLAQRLKGQEKQNMQREVKYIAKSMAVALNPSALTLSAVVPYEEIMADTKILPTSQIAKGSYAFNAMDRNVQIGDGFAFSLSRSSNRIAKYEYMSGENLKPWFQGDGAFYVYLSGADQSKAYGVNYFAAMDPYRFPGTSVPQEERKTIPELYNSSYYPGYPAGSEQQNDYVYFPVGTNTISGSTTLDGNSAAMLQLGDDNAYAAKQKGLLPDDFVVYKNANANKSWFMFGNEVVVMGSHIYDKLGRDVTTTIDNQMADPSVALQLSAMDKNGNKVNIKDGTYKDLKWLSYDNPTAHRKIGYYFPGNKDITIKEDTRTGNLRDIRTLNPDKKVTEKFFTMTYEHGKKADDNYSYVMLPNASESQLAQYASKPNVTILENSKTVQAVNDATLHMSGYNFFEKGSTNGVEASAPATVLMKKEGKTTTLSVSDPTFTQNEIQINLVGINGNLISGDKRMRVTNGKDSMQIKANTADLYGQTISMQFTSRNLPQQKQNDNSNKPSAGKQTSSMPIQVKPTTQNRNKRAQTPNTGDSTKPWLYSGIFIISLTILIVLRMRLHSKKQK